MFTLSFPVVAGKRDVSTTSASDIEDLPTESDAVSARKSAGESAVTENKMVTSTSTGTSPPRQVVPRKGSDGEKQQKRTSTTSIGTSPPPQSISTQVSASRRLTVVLFYTKHIKFKIRFFKSC